MLLYHGTDIASALDILNHGLNAGKLANLQRNRPTQVGSGWYAAIEPPVAWFFASLAPGNRGDGFTVVELELAEDVFDEMVQSGRALIHEIHNVSFVAQQVWFDALRSLR